MFSPEVNIGVNLIRVIQNNQFSMQTALIYESAAHLVESNTRLIGPTPCHIPDCVASSSKEHQWQVVPDQNT